MRRYQITALKDLTVRASVWAGKSTHSDKTFRLLTGETRDDIVTVISVSDKFDPADPFPIVHPEETRRRILVAGLLCIEKKLPPLGGLGENNGASSR